MKKLVENFLEFIQTAKVAQEPKSFRIYSANPRKKSRKLAIARYAKKCKA